MPEFQVKAEILMYAEITPEGRFQGIDDLDDASRFFANEGLTFTGEISFPIEVEDQEDVEEAATDAINDRVRFRDDNGIEWSFDDIVITEVERITPPMDIDIALETLRAYLRLVATGQVVTPEQPNIEAFRFLVDWAVHQRHLQLEAIRLDMPVSS